MLSLDVAGGTIVDTVAVSKGETLNITARARVNPDIDSLGRDVSIPAEVTIKLVPDDGFEIIL